MLNCRSGSVLLSPLHVRTSINKSASAGCRSLINVTVAFSTVTRWRRQRHNKAAITSAPAPVHRTAWDRMLRDQRSSPTRKRGGRVFCSLPTVEIYLWVGRTTFTSAPCGQPGVAWTSAGHALNSTRVTPVCSRLGLSRSLEVSCIMYLLHSLWLFSCINTCGGLSGSMVKMGLAGFGSPC